MTARPFYAADPDLWPVMLEYALKIGPLPVEYAINDLTWLQDRTLAPRGPSFPKLRALANRWRWTTDHGKPSLGRVRGLLKKEHLWCDPRKAEAWAKHRAASNPNEQGMNTRRTRSEQAVNTEGTGHEQAANTLGTCEPGQSPNLEQAVNRALTGSEHGGNTEGTGSEHGEDNRRVSPHSHSHSHSPLTEKTPTSGDALALIADAGPVEPDAWDRCVALWKLIEPSARTGSWSRTKGVGKKIAAAIKADGAQVLEDRFRWTAHARKHRDWDPTDRASYLRANPSVATLTNGKSRDQYDEWASRYAAAGYPSQAGQPATQASALANVGAHSQAPRSARDDAGGWFTCATDGVFDDPEDLDALPAGALSALFGGDVLAWKAQYFETLDAGDRDGAHGIQRRWVDGYCRLAKDSQVQP